MAQPTLTWSMMCDYFLVDQAGKYSFVGVFDRIGATSFPAVQKSLYIAVALEGEGDAEATALIDIWAPDGALVASTNESHLKFSPAGRTIFVNLLFDLQFTQAGQYNVTVEVDGKPVGSFGFEVYAA
jgi:hypothetical protein